MIHFEKSGNDYVVLNGNEAVGRVRKHATGTFRHSNGRTYPSTTAWCYSSSVPSVSSGYGYRTRREAASALIAAVYAPKTSAA